MYHLCGDERRPISSEFHKLITTLIISAPETHHIPLYNCSPKSSANNQRSHSTKWTPFAHSHQKLFSGRHHPLLEVTHCISNSSSFPCSNQCSDQEMQRAASGQGHREPEEAQVSQSDQAHPSQTTQPQNVCGRACQAQKAPRPPEGTQTHPHIEKIPISLPSN